MPLLEALCVVISREHSKYLWIIRMHMAKIYNMPKLTNVSCYILTTDAKKKT